MATTSGRRKRTWNYDEEPLLHQARLMAVRDDDQFIQNFLHIKTKEASLEKLHLNATQRIVSAKIRELEKERKPIRLYILKSRQVGLSTYCAAKIFTRTYRKNNVDSLIIAHRKDRTAKLLQMCHLFQQQMPDQIRLPMERATVDQMRFAAINSGVNIITGGSADASRGSTSLLVHASEISYYQDLYGQMGALEQTVPYIPESMVLMETTANGAGTDAHRFWQGAGEGENPYIQMFLKWFKDPLCQLMPFKNDRAQAAFVEEMTAEWPESVDKMDMYKLSVRQIGWLYETLKYKCYGDELLLAQEYPCDADEAWISSGTPVFPVQMLAAYRAKTRPGQIFIPQKNFKSLHELKRDIDDKNFERSSDNYIEVWTPPVPGARYLIGGDPSAGYADGDYASAFVGDRKTMNTVAEIHGRFEPDEFAHVLASMSQTYNDAIVAPETTGVGLATLAALQQFCFRIYMWRMIDSYGLKITNRLGWSTNSQSRPIMIAESKRLFKERARYPESMGAFIPSRALIDELRTFTVDNLAGRPAASNGCHDDRCMAWFITMICILQEEYGMLSDDARTNTPGGPQETSKSDNRKMEDIMSDVMDDINGNSW